MPQVRLFETEQTGAMLSMSLWAWSLAWSHFIPASVNVVNIRAGAGCGPRVESAGDDEIIVRSDSFWRRLQLQLAVRCRCNSLLVMLWCWKMRCCAYHHSDRRNTQHSQAYWPSGSSSFERDSTHYQRAERAVNHVLRGSGSTVLIYGDRLCQPLNFDPRKFDLS